MTLIGYGNLPEVRVDPEALAAAATALRIPASQVGGQGTDLVRSWNGIDDGYDAPETSELRYKMAVVDEAAGDFQDAFTRIATILSTCAETLASARHRLEALRDEIGQLRASVADYRSGLADYYGTTASQLTDTWGPGQYTWNQSLLNEREAIRALVENALDEARSDLRTIGEPHGLGALTAVVGRPALGLSWNDRHDAFASDLSLTVLDKLSLADADEVRMLMDAHPEWIELLRDHPPSAEAVEAWWSGLDGDETRRALTQGAPTVVGSLGGVPPLDRVAANAENASSRLATLDAEIAQIVRDGNGIGRDTPHAREASVADYLSRLHELETEADYLRRAAAGDVQLYLFEPERDRIIEMVGDPGAAARVMTFVPGTNTTVETFYGDPSESIAAFAHWQVEFAPETAPVAAFVFKDGTFPQLDANLLATGPQNNAMAADLGANYRRLLTEIDATMPGVPVVSVEHSFGTAVVGKAETLGAQVDARIMLGGIGMTSDWQRNDGTEYYAYRAPNDINRALSGYEAGDWGYGITPSEDNGITEKDTGMAPASPTWRALGLLGPVGMLASEGILLNSSIDNHNRTISPEPTENGTILWDVHGLIDGVGTSG